VSGFSLEPMSIITPPIMMFNASTRGRWWAILDKRFIAISGDHEPIMSPPL
jgi:hypothetical protein